MTDHRSATATNPDRPDATSAAAWDIFLSYARADARAVRLVVAALRRRGLRVFVDESGIGEFTSITATITAELARSKALVAYYSVAYPQRRACLWELTAAYLAGQREGDPRRRVLVLNPEAGAEHVEPVELRDARHWVAAGEPPAPAELQALAHRIARHVHGLAGTIGEVEPLAAPPWLPAPSQRAPGEFVGRLGELWQVHTALHPHAATLLTGATRPGGLQLRGPAGIGKTALAAEYARRFSAAFPGGVYWLDVHPDGPSEQDSVLDRYSHLLSLSIAALTQTDPTGARTDEPGEIASVRPALPGQLSLLGSFFARRGEPFLWVVDGVPDRLTASDLRRLHAPSALGATLFTSRSRRLESLAPALDLEPLPEADALSLLTAPHPPTGAEAAAALALVTDLGGHPLAVQAARHAIGRAPGSHPYRDIRAAMAAGAHHDTGEQASSIADELAAAFMPDLCALSSAGLDVLRIHASLSPAAASTELTSAVLVHTDRGTAEATRRRVTRAVAELHGRWLVDRRGDLLAVPRPVAWIVRHRDPDPVRLETLREATLHHLGRGSAITLARDPFRTLNGRPAMPTRPTKTQPTEIERVVAFDLQVELATRVGVQRLGDTDGLLQEALTSLHTLFSSTRDSLRHYAPDLAVGGAEVAPQLAERLLDTLRPFLSHWHPRLDAYHSARPAETSAFDHERTWIEAATFRAELTALHAPLSALVDELAAVSGTDLGRITPA